MELAEVLMKDGNSPEERVPSRAPAKRDFLTPHLMSLPLHRVLLRSIECRLLSRYTFERPMLDVGVGDGHFASILFPDGVDSGVDPSAESIEEARRRGVYRDLRVASASALPYPDSRFRSVLSNCVLEHIPELDLALSEIARVLEPGGLFAFTVPSPNYERFLLGYSIPQALRLGALARAYGGFMTRISYHYHYYSPEEWSRRLAAKGFSVREWRYYGSPATHRMIDLGHYLSAPSLLSRKLTGRWVLFPSKPVLGFQRAVLHRFYAEETPAAGAYIQFACVKES
jgi:ubiquinone/menaquinone biosynthesis C-methylase UbiE